MAPTLDYAWSGEALGHGDWVCVPLGRKTTLGLVVDQGRLRPQKEPKPEASSPVSLEKIKPIQSRLVGFPAVDPNWIEFMGFASRYYRRPLGTVVVGLLPKWLRSLPNFETKVSAKGREMPSNFAKLMESLAADPSAHHAQQMPRKEAEQAPLNPAQQVALDAIAEPGVHLLHGVTGSGKTRVYTEAAKRCLENHTDAQVLMMVPEIGLTPQLVERFRQALPGVAMAVLHSEVTERERARLWLSAALGQARLVIGTRLAIMTPMPKLALIMIDEEHDHSYKQQEGMRYSARDLAVWRAQQVKASLVLGSATPSIESWAQAERGRYQRLSLPKRATGEPAAAIELVDTLKDPAKEGLSQKSRAAIEQVLTDGGQVLVFLNRRGYAPVLACSSCGWSSQCKECLVPTVLHRPSLSGATSQGGWKLQCHHCGLLGAVPRSCPDCGDTDLQPIGRGVQRLEETLHKEFPQARICRIDRDSVKQAKALQTELERIERGEVDIVVGTQMLAKGHDFARMRLVVVADADTQLLNPDFRAPERLFATLVQVAGRAGRHEQSGAPARVLIQTRYPQHRLYQFLIHQDVEGFARHEMKDRQAAGLPPFRHMAAVRASHAEPLKAQKALRALRDQLEQMVDAQQFDASAYGPVARYPETQAGRWRGQVLVEAADRAALHHLMALAEDWMADHRSFDPHVDVDPHEV